MELFIEVLLFTLIGCSCGIVTGLVPGIHINMVAALVLAGLPAFAGFSPIAIASWIMAMSVTHTFLDFIPSILLGAPEAESALAVLPGHRMLLEGRAIEAIKLTALGSLCSLLVTAALFLIVIGFVQTLYSILKPILLWVLLFIVLSSLIFEKKPHWALLVFLLAGFFGFFTLDTGLFSDGILFPALSGLFGVSTLLLSL
jgi:putative membrane protein